MPLTKEKIKHFQEKLEEEKKQLESELSRVGKKNPEVAGDWEAVPEDLNGETSDTGELAAAVENTLEERFILVSRALDAVKKETYGVCSSQEGKPHPIEYKRLEANPAATECIKHAGI